MCGSATFTMVVSSTWISVAAMTANVISRRSALLGNWAMSLASGLAHHAREDAALRAIEQRLLVGIAPPARKAAALAMPDHDQIGADLARDIRNVVERIAIHEQAVRFQAAGLQP